MDTTTLLDRIERMDHMLTAPELAKMLSLSRVTVYKLAAAHQLPCLRIGTTVRFDPKLVAEKLKQG